MVFIKVILAISIFALWTSAALAIPSFPGAEGWGTDATGGRGWITLTNGAYYGNQVNNIIR